MHVGDGTGGSEKQIPGLYTIEECLAKVKEEYPNTANGITVSNPCKNKCKCYAEINMSDWITTRKNWQACIFKSGNHTFYTLANWPPIPTCTCPLGSCRVELVRKGF